MGNPGLLQELPDIAALLPEAGGDGEQAAAADRTLCGLDPMADLALNHRLAQGTLCGVVGGLDSLDVQEGPQRTCHLQELSAGAHGAGPRRSLAVLSAQLHHLLQRGLKGLSNRPAAVLQGGPVNRAVCVAMPVVKQLLLQAQQLGSELGAGARAFGDGGEIADQVRPAELPLLGRQMVVGREAIAHHNPAKAAPEQLDRGGCGAAQTLDEHRHCGRHHDPLPAPLAGGIVAVGVAGGGAGFIHVGHRLLTGKGQGLLHGPRQGCAQTLADLCNRSTAHLHPQQLIEQRLGLAETQRKDTAQQTHQGAEPRSVRTRFHISRQRCAGAGGAAGADQAMQPMLDHHWRDRRDVNHLMA